MLIMDFVMSEHKYGFGILTYINKNTIIEELMRAITRCWWCAEINVIYSI